MIPGYILHQVVWVSTPQTAMNIRNTQLENRNIKPGSTCFDWGVVTARDATAGQTRSKNGVAWSLMFPCLQQWFFNNVSVWSRVAVWLHWRKVLKCSTHHMGFLHSSESVICWCPAHFLDWCWPHVVYIVFNHDFKENKLLIHRSVSLEG